MKRRDFVQSSFSMAMSLPFLKLPPLFRAMRMGIVVHSYALRWNSKVESQKYPGFRDAIGLMEHCHEIGAGGVQVMVRDWSQDFAKKVRDRREKLGLFLEGSISLPKHDGEIGAFERDVLSAKEAGASIVRTVCLSGRRYENFSSLQDFQDFKARSISSLKLAESVVRKHKMRLAVENHKDWTAAELLSIMKSLGSEWVGVNLDFGNNVALMENPMEVVESLAPYTFTTHVKDMGVKEYADGFLLSEVPLGEGFLDLKGMFDRCRRHFADVNFNLEMITRDPLKVPCLSDEYWTTFPAAVPQTLATALRTVRQHSFKTELPEVSHLSAEDRLDAEEKNIVTSLQYSKSQLGMS